MPASQSQSSSAWSQWLHAPVAWGAKAYGVVAGLVATLWRRLAGGEAQPAKPPRRDRRAEKRRRKELMKQQMETRPGGRRRKAA